MSGRGKKESATPTILDQPASNTKRACTVMKDWPQKYHFIELVVDDDSRVRCKIYDNRFSIFHGGENDITRHAAGPIYKTNVFWKNTNKLMTDFVMTKLDPNTDKVTAEECNKIYHTIQHEHLYRSADCDTKLCQTVFPDADIEKKLSCGRTKAEATVTGVLAPASVDDSLGILHRNMIEIEEEDLTPYFSIASDASNYGSSRMFPVAIIFWTPQDGMHNRVLDFYSDSEQSAESIANQLTSNKT
jgi:hypothetical protein